MTLFLFTGVVGLFVLGLFSQFEVQSIYGGETSKDSLGIGAKILVRWFNPDSEGSVSTWFSATLLALAAYLLFVIGTRLEQDKGQYAKSWSFLSLLFLLLSMDEAVSIHEYLGLLDTTFHLPSRTVWCIPMLLGVAVLAVCYMKWYLSLPKKVKWLFGVAAVVFLGGAVGMEQVGLLADSLLHNRIAYAWSSAVEEAMEMLGVVLFIQGVFTYARTPESNLELSSVG